MVLWRADFPNFPRRKKEHVDPVILQGPSIAHQKLSGTLEIVGSVMVVLNIDRLSKVKVYVETRTAVSAASSNPSKARIFRPDSLIILPELLTCNL